MHSYQTPYTGCTSLNPVPIRGCPQNIGDRNKRLRKISAEIESKAHQNGEVSGHLVTLHKVLEEQDKLRQSMQGADEQASRWAHSEILVIQIGEKTDQAVVSTYHILIYTAIPNIAICKLQDGTVCQLHLCFLGHPLPAVVRR